MRKLMAAAVTAAMMLATSAQAHYLWIEPANGVLVIRFGELQEKLRETEDTHLKSVKGPSATLLTDGAFKPVELKRLNDGFAYPANGAGATLTELGFGLMDQTKAGKGFTKLEYYGRFADVGTKPTATLKLDIVPIADDKVRVTLNGKVVPDSKVTFVGIDLKEVALTTDKNGEVTLPAITPGLHVIEAMTRETQPGTHEGKPYDGTLYIATLSLLKK